MNRQSGRTTRTLLQAVIALSENKSSRLYIIGRTYDQLSMHLIPEFRRLCQAVNLNLIRLDHYSCSCEGLQTVVYFQILGDVKSSHIRAHWAGPTFIDHYARE